MIKQLSQDLAELDELAELVRGQIELIPSSRERARLRKQFERAVKGENPNSRLPRASWTSTEWLIEAEYQKATARKYLAAGQSQKAAKCEAAGQKAKEQGLSLKTEGR